MTIGAAILEDQSRNNQSKLKAMENAIGDILKQVLQPGVFGKATIEVSVHDGAIQWVRRVVEKFDK